MASAAAASAASSTTALHARLRPAALAAASSSLSRRALSSSSSSLPPRRSLEGMLRGTGFAQQPSAPRSAAPHARGSGAPGGGSAGGFSEGLAKSFFAEQSSLGLSLSELAARSAAVRREREELSQLNKGATAAGSANISTAPEHEDGLPFASATGGPLSFAARMDAVRDAFSKIADSYAALLSQCMSQQRPSNEVLRVLGEMFSQLPADSSALSPARRVELVHDVLRGYYIAYGRRIESKVGEAVEGGDLAVNATLSGMDLGGAPRGASSLSLPANAASAGSSVLIGGTYASDYMDDRMRSPGGLSSGIGLGHPSLSSVLTHPRDLFRDVVLAHDLPINLETLKLLVEHAARRGVPQDTVQIIHFLRHYARHMRSVAPRDFERAAIQAAQDASPPGSVTTLSPSFHLLVDEVNALLEVFASFGDESGATLFFTELAPSVPAEGGRKEANGLFAQVRPNNRTYRALLVAFCKRNNLANALSLVKHINEQVLLWDSRFGDSASDAPVPRPEPLDMTLMESMISTLVEAGHTQSAIVVLQRLRNQEDASESFGLPPPSSGCFIPLLLEIPRWKGLGPRQTKGAAANGSIESLAASEQLMLLAELYASFRSLGHTLPDDSWLRFLELTALMGSGMEVVATAGPSTADSSVASRRPPPLLTTMSEGFGERGLELRSYLSPPRGAIPSTGISPFANPQEPVEFALSVLNERLEPLMVADPAAGPGALPAGVGVPSVSSFNSLMFLFGVVLARTDFLAHFVALMQRYALAPNVHSMNILMESYGRGGAGMAENVAYMYAQVQQAAALAKQDPQAPGALTPNVQTFNIMLAHLPTVAPSPAEGSTHAPSPFDSLRMLLSDMKASGVAPNRSTWVLLLRKVLQIAGAEAEAAEVAAMLLQPATGATGASAGMVAQGVQGTSSLALSSSASGAVVQEPGVLFELCELLVECQRAAAVAPAAAGASSPFAAGAGVFGSGASGSAPLPNLLAGLPTATSTAVAAVHSPPALTEDVASLYLNYAGKLSDVRSVVQFLEAMKLASGAQLLTAAAAPSQLVNVARALPSSFCRHYFSNRANLRTQLQYRLALFDWQTPIALLRIWQTASVQGGVQAAGAVVSPAASAASADNLDTDNFVRLFQRRQTDATALSETVRACFHELVWGVDPSTGRVATKPLPETLLPLAVRQASVNHIAQALLVLEQFTAVVEFLDLVAELDGAGSPSATAAGEQPAGQSAERPVNLPFPSHVLQQLFKAVAHAHALGGGAAGEGQFDLRWKLSLLSRVTLHGRWHGALRSSVAKNDVFDLFSLALSEALSTSTSAAEGSTRLAPREGWNILSMALSVEEAQKNWLSDGLAIGSTGSGGSMLAVSPKHVRHPKLLEMANALLADWTSPLVLSPTSDAAARAAVVVLTSERLLHIQKLLAQFVSSADAHAAIVQAGVPLVVDPLLDATLLAKGLMYAMSLSSSSSATMFSSLGPLAAQTVHVLWRYSMGMSNPRLRYYSEAGDSLLMHPVALDADLAARAVELKVPPQTLRPVAMPDYVADAMMSYALGTGGAAEASGSSLRVPVFSVATTPPAPSARGDAGEYAVAPNPALGWEVYLHQLRERKPLSIRFYRTAILLQGCYPAVLPATPFDPFDSSASAASTSSSSQVAEQALLGRFQLMRVWKDIEDRLQWFEALGLLPYVLRCLVEQRFSPVDSEDLQLKELLLAMLVAWSSKHSGKPLPAVQDIFLQMAAAEGAAHADPEAQALAAREAAQHMGLGAQFRKRHTAAIQTRENKKLAEVRQIVEATTKACHEKMRILKQRQLARTTEGAASGARPKTTSSVAEAASALAAQASSSTALAQGVMTPPEGFTSSSPSSARRFGAAGAGSTTSEWLSSPSVMAVSRCYDRLLSRVQHPAHLDGDPSVEAKMVDLFRTPRDFVDLTVHKLMQGAFADPEQQAQRQGANAAATIPRPPALVFFDFMHTVLHFAHCKNKQSLFIRLLQSLSLHPQGLLAVLSPGSIKPNPTSGALAAKVVQQPQEDVMVALVQSLLHRRALAQASSEWARPVLSVGFGKQAPQQGATYINMSAPAGSAQGVHALELQYLSHPSWWLCQALYWHFRLRGLDTRAFDTDLVFAVKSSQNVGVAGATSGGTKGPEREGGVLHAYNSPTAIKAGLKAPLRPPNPFTLTPRRVYTWISANPAIDARQLLLLAYDSTFQFLVHQVKMASNKGGASMSAAAVLDDSSASASSSGAPLASPEALALHSFTFHLFKHRYMLHKEEGESRGKVVRPRREVAELHQALQRVLQEKRITKAALDAAITGPAGAVSSAASSPAAASLVSNVSTSSSSLVLGGALCSGPEGNTLYELFHLLCRSAPAGAGASALSENVFNMVLASLAMFADGSGLSGARRAQVGALVSHMQSALAYRTQPVSVAYVAQAALEQARMDVLAEPSSAAGQARARDVLQFAAGLLDAHLHPRHDGPSFEFGRLGDSGEAAAAVAPPNFPPPTLPFAAQ